jgi:hypothetical protein
MKLNKSSLKKVGVTLVDLTSVHLRCDRCGATWSPNLQSGGRLPDRYWHCPNGCNVPAKKTEGAA